MPADTTQAAPARSTQEIGLPADRANREQRLVALAAGTGLRMRKAAALRKLRKMKPSAAARAAAQSLRMLPGWARPATSEELLQAVPKIGPARARRMCAAAGVLHAPPCTLGRLGPRARDRLAAELDAFAAHVNDTPMTCTAPNPDQMAAALARANEVRVARAQRLAAISAHTDPAAGARAAAELIRTGRHDERLAGITLTRVLTAIHRVGDKRATTFLAMVDVHTDLALSALSDRRAETIAGALVAYIAQTLPSPLTTPPVPAALAT